MALVLRLVCRRPCWGHQDWQLSVSQMSVSHEQIRSLSNGDLQCRDEHGRTTPFERHLWMEVGLVSEAQGISRDERTPVDQFLEAEDS